MRTIAVTLFLVASGLASASTQFTYQGQLQSGGQLYSGTAGLVFALYDGQASTNKLAEINRNVEVTQGLFQATLDFGEQPYASDLWLEITVNGAR